MPIKNLTDRETLKPRFPRIGKLRKGAEKSGNKPGDDLDHFRFTSDNENAVQAFRDVYGDNPRVVNAVMCYHDYDNCFSSWIECWDASGLVFRSDGENWLIWRDGSAYKRGTKPHTDVDGQRIVGRLEFIIPELWDLGYRGSVTLETHSNHDLRHIGGVLLAAESGRESLYGMQFVLRRVQEEISTPGWGERADKRSKAKKWLVKLEPPWKSLPMDAPQMHFIEETTGEITDDVIDNTPFNSPDEAVSWGFTQGCFNAHVHAENAYKKLRDEHKPHTAQEMAALWRADVARRVEEME